MGRRFSKSGLFLMELVIAIGFFAVASAVCAQLFAHAHTTSRNSRDLSMAVVVAQSAAESFKAAPHSPDMLMGQYTGDGYTSYDADWSEIPYTDDSPNMVIVHVTNPYPMLRADISVRRRDDNQPIYSITVQKYIHGAWRFG